MWIEIEREKHDKEKNDPYCTRNLRDTDETENENQYASSHDCVSLWRNGTAVHVEETRRQWAARDIDSMPAVRDENGTDIR